MEIGSKAPEILGHDQNGKEIKLSDYAGRKIALYFYPKDLTSGCTTEACNLRDNYSELRQAGYEVIGVSVDDEKSHNKFIARTAFHAYCRHGEDARQCLWRLGREEYVWSQIFRDFPHHLHHQRRGHHHPYFPTQAN